MKQSPTPIIKPGFKKPEPIDSPQSTCPKCGARQRKKMFRTGSTQHPGRDMNVCDACGTHD